MTEEDKESIIEIAVRAAFVGAIVFMVVAGFAIWFALSAHNAGAHYKACGWGLLALYLWSISVRALNTEKCRGAIRKSLEERLK